MSEGFLMVRFFLRGGRKSERDVMVFVVARDEVLTFHEWLFIGSHYFNSESDYYPVGEGYLGKGMLLGAVCNVLVGVPLPIVVKRFKLPFKPLDVVDQRVRVPVDSFSRGVSSRNIARFM